MLSIQMWHDLIDQTLDGLDLNLPKDIETFAAILNGRDFFRSQMRKFNAFNSTEYALADGAHSRLLAFADMRTPPLSARRPASSLFRRMAREPEESEDLPDEDYLVRFERFPDRPGQLTLIAHYRDLSRLMTFFWIGPGLQADTATDDYRAVTHNFTDFRAVDAAAER